MKKIISLLILSSFILSSLLNAASFESGSNDAKPVVLYGKTSNGSIVPFKVDSSGTINVSGSPTPNFIGTQKYNGSAGGANMAGPDTSERTAYFKMEAESDFVRVRIGLLNNQANAAGGYTAIAAVTETANDSTSDNRWQPVVGGTATAQLQDGTHPYGWRSVTFNGQTSGNIPGAPVEGVYSRRPQVLWSDWIEMNSVARADGGTRPLFMFRVYKNNTDGQGTIIIDTGSGSAGHHLWDEASAEDFYRIYAVGRRTAVDGVTNISTVPTETTIYGNGNYVPVIVQFEYKVPARTVMCIGDSIQEGGGYQIYNYDNFSLRGLMPLSTTAKPINIINLGMSSNPSSTYMQHAFEMLDSGIRPTDILVEGFSPNDVTGGQQNTYTNQARQALIFKLLEKAKKINAKVYLWTYAYSRGSAGPDASVAWSEDLASKGLVTLVDIDSLGTSIIGADATHISLTGLASAATVLANTFTNSTPGVGGVDQVEGGQTPGYMPYYDQPNHIKQGPLYYEATSGNVGYGTLWPSQRLDVVGTIKATAFSGDGSALTGISGSISGLTTNKLTKATSGTTIGDSSITDNGTNVGIGTATPQNFFTVGTTGAFQISSTGTIARINSNASINMTNSDWLLSAAGTVASFGNASSTSASFTAIKGSAATNGFVDIRSTTGTGSGDYIKITGGTNGGTEIARFLGSGNVGIGTSAPVAKLDINGTGSKIRMQSADGTFWNCQPANTTGAFTCI